MDDGTIAWEYYTVRVSAGYVDTASTADALIVTLDAELARLGQEGWELVSLLQEPVGDPLAPAPDAENGFSRRLPRSA